MATRRTGAAGRGERRRSTSPRVPRGRRSGRTVGATPRRRTARSGRASRGRSSTASGCQAVDLAQPTGRAVPRHAVSSISVPVGVSGPSGCPGRRRSPATATLRASMPNAVLVGQHALGDRWRRRCRRRSARGAGRSAEPATAAGPTGRQGPERGDRRGRGRRIGPSAGTATTRHDEHRDRRPARRRPPAQAAPRRRPGAPACSTNRYDSERDRDRQGELEREQRRGPTTRPGPRRATRRSASARGRGRSSRGRPRRGAATTSSRASRPSLDGR